MWCYQKPGFEALLLTELQRQQQRSQFCDTLLKAEGVSVPAHSCILSAISPHISSALASTPAPPVGQSRLLEFQALGPCTLLHMVRLLYCGEMTGEGEIEKQEAISAAAELGIHGLVEVTKRDRESRTREGAGKYTEVEVQTDPPMPEGSEGQRGRWMREVRDGSTLLWKETLSHGGNDMWTQTEELQINAAPYTHPAASFETIDMVALQSLGQTDSHLVPTQIIPISFVYPPNENQTLQPSSAPSASMQESTSVAVVAPQHTPVHQTTPCAADPLSCVVTAAEEWQDEQFEQFQGNIPGFIRHFLNPDKKEGSRRRAGRRRGAGAGGARRAATGENRARRPQARSRGRGRGGFTQRVDVQEVGVGKLQKQFLHRCGMRAPRAGQGGGAVGRKLYLNTRGLLKGGRGRRRGDVLLCSEGRGGNGWRGRKKTPQQSKQDALPVGRPQRSRAKSTTAVSLSIPSTRSHSVRLSNPCHQPPPSTNLLLPAPSLLHTTALPPHEDQPEHIDHLLEEVMMGLDILPDNSSALESQCSPPASSCSFASSGNAVGQNKKQRSTTGLRRSTEVVAVAQGPGCSSSANSELPVLRQQCEGELNDMLDLFFQSFEQHVERCSTREEEEMRGESSTEASQPYGVQSKSKNSKIQSKTLPPPHLEKTHASRRGRRSKPQSDDTPQSRSQPHKASAGRAVSLGHTEETPGEARAPAKQRNKRPAKPYPLSLKKKIVREPVSSDDTKTKVIHDHRDKQLEPVVKLKRHLLPVRVTLQGHSCQSLEDKSPARTKTDSSSVRYSQDTSSGNNQPAMSKKTYPIRSRLREEHITTCTPFHAPLQDKQPPSTDQPGCRQGRPKSNEQLHSLPHVESSTPPVLPQPVAPCGTDEQLETNQERHEAESTVQPQEEEDGPSWKGRKREAESNEDVRDDATVTKRVCVEQMAQLTCETCIPSSESAHCVSEPAAIVLDEVVDVETVSLSSTGDRLQEEKQKEKVWSEIKLRETEDGLTDEETESSADEIIDVEGDHEDSETLENKEADEDRCQSRAATTLKSSPSHPAHDFSLESTASREEDNDGDIDVIGASSPVPDPVFICWTEASGGEEEDGDVDVDVVGGKTGCLSEEIFAAVSKGEFVDRGHLTEVLY